MFTKKQAVEIVEKLTELTQHNLLNWESVAPPLFMNSPDSRVDLVYTSQYSGTKIRIYLHHFKYNFDDERYIWDSQINFEFIDNIGNSIGMLPRTPNAYDLLHAVQFQNPQISGFYDSLFK